MLERDWASLERGLLHDVFTRLPVDADAASFRHVCRGWRAASGPGAPVAGPWFALRSAADGRRAFVRPARRRRRVRPVRLDAAAGGEKKAPACVRGVSRGWLAVDDGGRLLLTDPVSRAEVPLPAFGDPDYQLTDIFLSDDPLVAAGRWTAFAFFKVDDISYAGHVLAFCRPGDAEWARFDHQDTGPFYWGLEFFRGRAYVLVGVYRDKLAICDVDTRRLIVSPVCLRHLIEWEWDTQECLVECGGDLLVVVVSHHEHTRSSCCVRRRRARTFVVRVVKVHFAGEGGAMPVAVSNVAHTRDYALFVAPHGHAFALPASGFPAVRRSCVYHFATKITTRNVSGMVITDLLDRKRHRHQRLRKLPFAGHWYPLSWFSPRCPSLDTTPARRHWWSHS
ncbi:hypothetical protein C2845_PM01G39640 [Panicum miliaceum]|uniref:KIB1-4 beta-propeller domain-containing protein n=1 Tax=Panicum miliaceum TaxID=4540 RepID=A0A3L6TGR1_PANMI|nr:hypothetical protein C2845_PM01G39640 [Panicum miliaceum]